MEDTQDNLSQENSNAEDENQQDGNAEGMEEQDGSNSPENASKDDPYSVKKRLGMQAKRHQREMRAMQEQMAHMHARLGQPNADTHAGNAAPYSSPGQPNPPSGSEEERIQRAVRYALEAKTAEERKAKDAERHAHVQKQYQRLDNEFDKASDKYEDFDDVVRGHDVPFSTAIRDALLFVDNPAEVAYKLGKNRQELSRISELHPLDQAREITKLSFALMGGNGKQNSTSNGSGSKPMNQIKTNPANYSGAITDKTPASTIRARMKAGTWK